ncbi:hypothetical protein GGR92_005246 [Spirosoma lacussanchae]|uniref:hypothetical protein n=1 Tax=Spirosoma lacussanchae TaxID=1884249 RepID=UPI0011086168|nr:hypothetical protein [Spirosoma lacussanchae]
MKATPAQSLIHHKINYRSRIAADNIMAHYTNRQRNHSRQSFLRVLISYGDRPQGTPQLRPHDAE